MAATPTTRTPSDAAQELAEHGIHFMDVGTSGGTWGLTNGFCLMVGGSDEAVERMEPAFHTLAPSEETVGYLLSSAPTGAGHFVKMVHNGGGIRPDGGLRRGLSSYWPPRKTSTWTLPPSPNTWRYGSCSPLLAPWTSPPPPLKEDPRLEGLQAYVEDSGEGRWTVRGIR